MLVEKSSRILACRAQTSHLFPVYRALKAPVALTHDWDRMRRGTLEGS